MREVNALSSGMPATPAFNGQPAQKMTGGALGHVGADERQKTLSKGHVADAPLSRQAESLLTGPRPFCRFAADSRESFSYRVKLPAYRK